MPSPHQTDDDLNQRLVPHSDGAAVRNEIHARPLTPVALNTRGRRILFSFADSGVSTETLRQRLLDWCAQENVALSIPSERQISYSLEERTITVEFHTEFLTFTWYGPLNGIERSPFELGLQLFEDLPYLAKCRIDVTDTDHVEEPALAGFDRKSLCHVAAFEGRAEIATDFRSDAAGFTRYELAGAGLTPTRLSIVARRLLEIDTYRVMAMLGLPLARRWSSHLSDLENRLTGTVSHVMSSGTSQEKRALLLEIGAVAEQSEHVAAQTRYRFAADRAYLDILRQRLSGLQEKGLGQSAMLSSYLNNRVEPAVATCNAFERRLQAIQTQAARTTDLLATRVELDLQEQNTALLDRISQTTRNQYRLQTTIESISTIALSYYMLGILSYVLEPLKQYAHVNKTVVIAAAAPFVVGLVYLGIRRLRSHHAQ